jgi:sn-glycerol 3-phosphate transport system ATP-binding protein
MVFQNYALYPHMSVAENIGYALKVAGIARTERLERVLAVARVLELEPLMERKPAQLSGGQRQRVAMGRAMIREPKVFLFDEPLSNLDAKLRVAMRSEIRKLHRRLKATSIFVTHDQMEAMTLADRLIVMNGGHVEQSGTPSEIYNEPASRFVAAFVGSPAMNLLEGVVERNRLSLFGRPFADLLRPPAEDGSRVTVGIRPEAARIVASGTPGAFEGKVDLVEELGAGRVIYVDLDGVPFSVATADSPHYAPGNQIAVLLPAARLHLFSSETGKRLPVQPAPPGDPSLPP